MAVSLFRRWRSQKFSDLVGQESVVSTLQNVLGSGSPARAYLFCGPRGTGKTSSARIFAKALNCEKGPSGEPCNECSQCRSISDGSNLDVFEIDAASHTQVDKIRDFIVEKVHFTPVSARFKVYIIDEVHKLSTSSFNALLKTLEEPPSHVVFILATTHPHEMPATILSRCQRYDFRPLTATEAERHLLTIAEVEKLDVDVDAARQLARAADGSLRDALVLFEQAVVFCQGRVTREKVLDLLGGVGYEVLEEMFLDLCGGRGAQALERLDGWITRGRDLKRLGESLQEHLRMMLLLKVKSTDSSIEHLVDEERASLDRLCGEMSLATISGWLKLVMEMMADIRHGHGARLEWEMLLVTLAHPEVDPTLDGVSRRVERLESSGTKAGGITGGVSEMSPATVQRLETLEARIVELSRTVESVGSSQTVAPPASSPEPVRAVEPAPEAVESEVAAIVERSEQQDPKVSEPVQPAPVKAQTSASEGLARDVVDDWLAMPSLLVDPAKFRQSPVKRSEPPVSLKPDRVNSKPDQSAPEVLKVAAQESRPEPELRPVSQPKPQQEEKPAPEMPPAPEANVSPASVADAPQQASEAVAVPEKGEFWRRFMQSVKEQDIRLHAVLADARLITLTSTNFEVALPSGYDWHWGKVQEGRKLLEEMAGVLLSVTTLTLDCTLGGEKASPPKDTEHDDLVQRASGVFGGASVVE